MHADCCVCRQAYVPRPTPFSFYCNEYWAPKMSQYRHGLSTLALYRADNFMETYLPNTVRVPVSYGNRCATFYGRVVVAAQYSTACSTSRKMYAMYAVHSDVSGLRAAINIRICACCQTEEQIGHTVAAWCVQYVAISYCPSSPTARSPTHSQPAFLKPVPLRPHLA